VGGASYSAGGIGGFGFLSTKFGVNAENPSFQLATSEVWNGELREADQATYIGWFRQSYWVTVFTIHRTVKTNGEISYGALRNGWKPIADYLLYCALLGVVGVVFIEVVRVRDKRKKAGVAS